MSLSAGDKLGPYEILAPLGAGGMGEVYRAKDTKLAREVAIKVLPGALGQDPERLARLEREAKVLASLNHPNIAQIYGLEGAALVMELVEGRTLTERIAAGPIPLDEALALAHQIGDALEAAHEKGIVHRDLKPANIMLTGDNQVKVLDFGLAKAFEVEAASGNPANSPTLTLDATRAGMILGTAGYMSPEQARAKPVDKRADIWAFGVVLFEMLTGRTTFEGETVSDTLAAVLRADIDWNQLPAGTPDKVKRLLHRCLERDVKKRLRDVGDAWIEMDAREQGAAAGAPVAAPQNKLWWLGWAAAAVACGAGLGWAALHRTTEEARPVVRWTYTQKSYIAAPVLSRDGTRLEYLELAGAAAERMVLRMMDQIDPKPLPGGENLGFGAFSPDGQWIAALTLENDPKLKKIPISGGTAITLADGLSTTGMSWGDDGTIAFATSKGLMRISSSGGAAENLTTPDSKKGETAHAMPYFLPGARALLFTIGSGTGRQIAALDLKTRTYHVVASNGTDGRYAPTGHLLFVRGGTLFAAPFDADKLAATGPEAPVVEGVSSTNSWQADYAISGNGSLVYIEGGGQTNATSLAWAGPQGEPQAISEAALWGRGRLSPDGRRIANSIHQSTTNYGDSADIWVFDTERKIKTKLTFGGVNLFPIWTPDGRRITYGDTANGKNGIYWVAADGSGRPEQLLPTDPAPTPSSWSPDGKFLLYSQSVDKKPARIWVLPVSGGAAGKPYPLHEAQAGEVDAQVSPDGRWVAYVSTETGQNEVYMQPFPGPGGRERVSTQGGDSPRWARNGRTLYYRVFSGDAGVTAVDVQTSPQVRLSLPRVVVRGLFGSTLDTAPDGKRFLVELTSAGAGAGGRMMMGIDNWFEELKRRVPVK